MICGYSHCSREGTMVVMTVGGPIPDDGRFSRWCRECAPVHARHARRSTKTHGSGRVLVLTEDELMVLDIMER